MIWYHLYQNFTKSNIPPWVFFTFIKLYKWYQVAQHTPERQNIEKKQTINATHFSKFHLHITQSSILGRLNFNDFLGDLVLVTQNANTVCWSCR